MTLQNTISSFNLLKFKYSLKKILNIIMISKK